MVFHDWTLDCATNGRGPVHKAKYEQLKKLDAGYGYTPDGGKTFPFRNKGFRISKLEAFYSQYPKYEFWINLKNNDKRSLHRLHQFISQKQNKTVVITLRRGVDWFKNNAPTIRVASLSTVKDFSIAYLAVGWSGFIPEACRNTILLLPPSMAGYFWGYPEGLASRLQTYGQSMIQ